MNSDTKSIVNRLKICGDGIKGKAKTKVMRTSLILLIKEIKRGFQRNMPYIDSNQKKLQKYNGKSNKIVF